MLRFVVLLKQGAFEAVACREEDVFRLARLRNAGICGVFDDLATAETFIETQQRILASVLTRAAACSSGGNG